MRLFSGIIIALLLTLSSSNVFSISEKDSLLTITKTSKNKIQIAEAALQLSNIYTNSASYDTALNLLKTAYETYTSENNEKRIIDCYMQYGILESYRGDYPRSANYFLRSLQYAEKTNDTNTFYAVCINLASVYSALEEYKKARYYLHKINPDDISENILLHINYLGNLGQIEYELGNFQIALNYLKQGIQLFGPNSEDLNLIQFYILSGDCALKLNLFDEAKNYYSKAKNFTDAGMFPIQEAHVYYGLAQLYLSINPNEALNYSKKSLEIASRNSVLDLVANNHELQSKIYVQLGDYKESLRQYKLYDSAQAKVFSEETKNDIQLLEANYQVQKSKSDIEKLELTNERNKLKNLLYLFGVLSALSIIVVLFILLRRRKLLNDELNKSNSVKDKLLSIIAHDLKSPLNNIVTVIDGIHRDEYSKEELSSIIESLNTQTSITLETLENLLKWGQAQLRGIHTNPIELSLKNEIDAVINLNKVYAESKNINVRSELSDDIKVVFDKDHFDFIIRNYISNAIKFSFSGESVLVKVEMKENEVTISVLDEGTGISAENAKSLFLPSPVINQGTGKEKGSGLALSLCKEFALLNNSTVGYKANTPKGSIFYLSIYNNR